MNAIPTVIVCPVSEEFGKGAESLCTTNSEGDLRSPEEFGKSYALYDKVRQWFFQKVSSLWQGAESICTDGQSPKQQETTPEEIWKKIFPLSIHAEHRSNFQPTLQCISLAESRNITNRGTMFTSIDHEYCETWRFSPRSNVESLIMHSKSCAKCGNYKFSCTIDNYGECEPPEPSTLPIYEILPCGRKRFRQDHKYQITSTRTKCMCPHVKKNIRGLKNRCDLKY
jgi:hypothetical protein